MGRLFLLYILSLFVMPQASAQRITHNFHDVTMPEALRLIEQHSHYTINFIYNDLEDFRVTANIKGKTVPEAIRRLIGFYPIRATIVNDSVISVECSQDGRLRYKGRVVDGKGSPFEFANISLLSVRDSNVVAKGVSNADGFFVIPCNSERVIARISFVGYRTVDLVCNNLDIGTVRLFPSRMTLKEVTVKSENRKAVEDGIVYIPTPEERRRSADTYTLLSRLMMPGLKVDVINKSIKTVYRENVHVFIDGVEAKDWELKSMRPKEVASVKFLLSPSDPRYKGYTSVVDFALRKYDYGGYVTLEGTQGFAYNNGDYDIAMKMRRNKKTYSAIVEGSYRHVEGNIDNANTTYTYLDGHQLNRKAWNDEEDKRQSYIGGFSMRYDSEKFIWTIQTGLRYGKAPSNTTRTRLLYDDLTASQSEETVSTHNLVPYVGYSFQLTKLPRESELDGEVSFSYNHNNSDSRYSYGNMLNEHIFNGYSEDVYLPSASLAYYTPLYKKNYLTAMISYNPEYYRTNYRGTNQTYQRLNNSYWNFYLRYRHKFSDKWNGSFIAYMPVQHYKVNDLKAKTTPYINGSLTISGSIGTKHSFYIRGNIAQTDIIPSYYNTVVRQDNEVEGSRGNSDLKTVRQAFALVTHTWMPSNKFSLNTSFSWDNIIHDIVPYWHEAGGLMVKEMINSGDFNPIYLHITPSLALFNNKLKINSEVSYVHEWHNGLFHVNTGYFGWYPSAYCDFAKNWTANINYVIGSGYGYMRGGSEMAKFADRLTMGVQYSKGNLFIRLQVNSPFRKDGWIKSTLISKYINSSGYLSRPSDSRYVSLTATYTFDFGKKINHGNNIRFDGSSKSSAL